MNKIINVEEDFIEYLCKNALPASVYLVNGIQLKGKIAGYDKYVVSLQNVDNSGKQLIYKHSISTIVPEARS